MKPSSGRSLGYVRLAVEGLGLVYDFHASGRAFYYFLWRTLEGFYY